MHLTHLIFVCELFQFDTAMQGGIYMIHWGMEKLCTADFLGEICQTTSFSRSLFDEKGLHTINLAL